MKQVIKKYETKSGKVLPMCLSMSKILQLKGSNKAVYKKVNKVLMQGPKDLEDNIDVLYGAYLCGCAADKEQNNPDGIPEYVLLPMSRERFMEEMSDDLAYNNKILTNLVRPKKN